MRGGNVVILHAPPVSAIRYPVFRRARSFAPGLTEFDARSIADEAAA
jgi:hypothetical protein